DGEVGVSHSATTLVIDRGQRNCNRGAAVPAVAAHRPAGYLGRGRRRNTVGTCTKERSVEIGKARRSGPIDGHRNAAVAVVALAGGQEPNATIPPVDDIAAAQGAVGDGDSREATLGRDIDI